MKKIKFLLWIFVAIMTLAACEKDDQIKPINDEPQADPCAIYLGTYDFIQVYDSIGSDGEWYENGYAGMNYDADSGYIIITKVADSTMHLNGYNIYSEGESSDTIHFFETQAHILPNGAVAIDSSSYTSEIGITFDITYGNLSRFENGLLTFRTEQYCDYAGYLFGFISTITCTPRSNQ